MRWALYVTLSPVWFDPGEFQGLTPFWVGPEVALGRPARAAGRELRDRPSGALGGGDGRGLQARGEHRSAHLRVRTAHRAYGGYPDIDALFKEQALVTDRRKREATLHQIQQLVHERVRFGPIWEYIWPSGVGPRVEEPALMLINPYPWSAPLEEVRLKRRPNLSAP